MNGTVINISNVRDLSSEPSTVIYSNPVTTVINRPDPPPVSRRYIRNEVCVCRNCCCGCLLRLLCMCYKNRCRSQNECNAQSHCCAFREMNF